MYGVPSENPTDHWVHQPTSEGPTDTEHFLPTIKGSVRPRNHRVELINEMSNQ